MLSSKEQLLTTLDKVQGIPILVVGDIILDRYVWGQVNRISPEAPVPVVDVKKNEDRLGGAGNVARNLQGLGVRASLCGLVGDDDEGQIVIKLLDKESIGRDGVLIHRDRPTSLKTRVIAHGQQVVRIDRESREQHSLAFREGFAAVVDAHLEASRAIVISDYGKGAICEPLLRKLDEAQTAHKIGLSSRPLVLDPHPANYGFYRHTCVAKPNRREAEIASGITIVDRESACKAAQALLVKWGAEMVVITLGEDGLLILSDKDTQPLLLDTVAQEVFDVSGAGDTVTAVLAAALAVGAPARVAGDLANIGAGIVVSEVGTMSVTLERLRCEIERLLEG